MNLSTLYRAFKAAEQAWRDAQTAAIGDRPAGDKITEQDATLTVVRGKTTRTNIDAATARLSPAMLRRVTKRVIDVDALKALRDAGKISADDFAAILTTTNNAPYLKVTFK